MLAQNRDPMLCSRETAVDVLNGWIAERTMVGVLFFEASETVVLNFPLLRFEMRDNGVVFYGPYESSFAVAFPSSDAEGYFTIGAPDSDDDLVIRFPNCSNLISGLHSAEALYLRIFVKSGCLLMYEVLATMNVLSMIQ